MEDVLGRRIKVIHLVGGGTQNELLNQMTADACGRSVITGPVEATAAGNILVQAMANGQVKSVDQIRQIVRNSFDVKHYQPNQTRQWDAAYARYRELMTH
jgi:rhamnulokinase